MMKATTKKTTTKTTKELLDAARTKARKLKADGHWTELSEHWAGYAAQLPGQAVPLFHFGEALIRCSNFDEADMVFARLRRDFVDSPSGWIGEAMLDEALNRWVQAEVRYRDLIARFPDNPACFQRLPKVLVKQGKVDEARQMLQDSLLKFPDRPNNAISQLEKLNRLRKTDIINQLIRTFSLTDYFEYNKFLAELAIHEIVCDRKQIAYIPENNFSEHQAKELIYRAEHLYVHNRPEKLFELDEVMRQFTPASFDIIFFDPLHLRPQVDLALQRLPLLLKPDGLLVVHDCNPHDAKLANKFRNTGAWCGQTYQAFAHFHVSNPTQSITIDTDLGVGVIRNRNLKLDYCISPGPDYEAFAADREKLIGLITVETFQTRLATGDLQALMTG